MRKVIRLWLPLVAGLLASTCGDPSDPTRSAQISQTNDVDFSKVKITVAENSMEVDPASPPETSSSGDPLRLTFSAEFDRTDAPTFVYDHTKWRITVGNTGANLTDDEISDLELGDGARIQTDSANRQFYVINEARVKSEPPESTPEGTEFTVKVDLAGTLNDDDAAVINAFLKKSGGERRIDVWPRYVHSGEEGDTRSLPPGRWAEDRGVIQKAPTLKAPRSNDGSLTLSWEPPSDLTPVERDANGKLIPLTGQSSTVRGFVAVYWDQTACGAAPASWKFRANAGLSQDKDEVECDYDAASASNSAAACNLGCGDAPDPDDLTDVPFDAVTVPAVVPTANGATASYGCYTVKRFGGSDNGGELGGLTNDHTYGVMLYVLNSAGRLSQMRSACLFATPRQTPLPGDTKSGGASRDRSDCFVVTAASGSPDSLAVRDWRTIRSRYLLETSFMRWYATHGPTMARWLDEHPWLKPPIHAVLTVSGRAIVAIDDTIRTLAHVATSAWGALVSLVTAEPAHAQEPTAAPTPEATPVPTTFRPEPLVDYDFRILGGVVRMTTDSAIWEHYYQRKGKVERPIHVEGQVSKNLLAFRYAEAGLGLAASYMTVDGQVPSTRPDGSALDADVIGRPHSGYSNGLYATLGARFNLAGYVGLRILGGAGMERLRTENAYEGKSTAASADEMPLGYTMWKKMAKAQAALDIYFGGLSPFDLAMSRTAYGLVDFGLTVYGEYRKDFSDSLSLDGWGVGGGLVFLFE